MDQPKPHQERLIEEVEFFAAALQRRLEIHVGAMPEPPRMTPEIEAHIRNRVGPKSAEQYLSIERAIALLAVEAADIGYRISQYRFIERYREHFMPADAPMRVAFHTHIQVMRGNEIYVIMEHGKAWLVFAHDLAAALDLAPTKMHKVLINRFTKAFERHLRERHKIVHAHERPSLVSRVASLAATGRDDREIGQATQGVVQTLIAMAVRTAGDRVDAAAPVDTVIDQLNALRLAEVDRECEEMWKILQECTDKLIDRRRLLPNAATSEADASND